MAQQRLDGCPGPVTLSSSTYDTTGHSPVVGRSNDSRQQHTTKSPRNLRNRPLADGNKIAIIIIPSISSLPQDG